MKTHWTRIVSAALFGALAGVGSATALRLIVEAFL
jgi:hypothetical protein